MGEADCSAVDSFTARISQIETLDLLESRKAAYQGVARLGIEALVLNNTWIQHYGYCRALWCSPLPCRRMNFPLGTKASR